MLLVLGHSHLQPENEQIRNHRPDKIWILNLRLRINKHVPQHIADTILEPVQVLEYLTMPQLSTIRSHYCQLQ